MWTFHILILLLSFNNIYMLFMTSKLLPIVVWVTTLTFTTPKIIELIHLLYFGTNIYMFKLSINNYKTTYILTRGHTTFLSLYKLFDTYGTCLLNQRNRILKNKMTRKKAEFSLITDSVTNRPVVLITRSMS